MRQSILIAPRHSVVEERPDPSIGPRDVLVRVKACGVCASELHGWSQESGAYPKELGHEVTGEVVAVGADVRAFRPGQLVTGLFSRGFAEYAVTREDKVIPVPPGMAPETALGEPLSCVISAARRTRVELGDTVAVVGLGFMGLLMLQAIRLKGPAKIIAVDVRKEALEKALRYGADEVYLPHELPDQYKMTSWDRLGKGYGVDVAIEASGAQAGLTLSGEMVREHGFLSIVGYHQGGPRAVDMELWNWKALEVLNAHERRAAYQMDCMRRGLELVERGRIDIASLVTHRFPLEAVDRGFEALLEKPAGFVKSVIVMD